MEEVFTRGKVYRRRDIHELYNGQRQGGISTCSNFPFIFIWSGPQGPAHGYRDQWENDDVYSYTGEGQRGDMQFIRGNLALREHLNRGKRVFLFRFSETGKWKFVSELILIETAYGTGPDSYGNHREIIRFFFRRNNSKLDYSPEGFHFSEEETGDSVFRLPNQTERQGIITSRVGQGSYRSSILHRWRGRCAVTEFKNPRILIASHIVPWKKSTDSERLDVDNGLLLSPVYDALFDRKLISFEDNGKIILSNEIQKHDFGKIGLTGKEKIRAINDGNKAYLDRHRYLLAEEDILGQNL